MQNISCQSVIWSSEGVKPVISHIHSSALKQTQFDTVYFIKITLKIVCCLHIHHFTDGLGKAK